MTTAQRALLSDAARIAGAENVGLPYTDIWHGERCFGIVVNGRRFRYTRQQLTDWKSFARAPGLRHWEANERWPRVARRLLDNVQD